MYKSTAIVPSPVETGSGVAFRYLVNEPVPVLVAFVADRVYTRDDDDGELPVTIGRAAEIRTLSDDVHDEHARLLLGLISQDFPAAHKLPLEFETEREQARRIVEEADAFSAAEKRALYDLVAQALIRCGHRPSGVVVPEDRLLTADETLELWVSYRLKTPIEEVDELVGRFQAAHNPLVDFLFREWGVIADRNLREPLNTFEAQAVRTVVTMPPATAIVYGSNDVPQTAAYVEKAKPAETPTDDAAKAKPKRPARRGRKGLIGSPRPRLAPLLVTFLGAQLRCKTSFILDLTVTRLQGVPRADHIGPGQHALTLARRKKELDRTRDTPGYDFDINTDTPVFAGRTALPITLTDIDGEEYNPETFGAAQAQHVQTTDALIIPVAIEGLLPNGEAAAAEDALFLSRLLGQHRLRTGLPIAITIPACDKLLTEAEIEAVAGCRLMPPEFPRRLLTSVALRHAGRVQGSAAERMRHATVQNPGIACSLNVLRVVDRFFARYEPLIREAVALTGSVEVFFTSTSTKASGWTQTYGAVDVIDWITAKLELQIRPALPGLVEREVADLTGRVERAAEVQQRIAKLEVGREQLQRKREENTTAVFVPPWNRTARLKAKDEAAEASILDLIGALEDALGLKRNAAAKPATRRAAADAAVAELTARIRSLEGTCPRR